MTAPVAPTRIHPTDEQAEALERFATGRSLVIEAGAGTGKTSTLRLLAASTSRQVQYVAFNKALVVDAKASMPANVKCNTAHSLAYGAVGRLYDHRLRGRRMRSSEVARILGLSPMWVTVGGVERKHLGSSRLAGVVMSALAQFCRTADDAPDLEHFPYLQGIDLPTPEGKRTYVNNHEVQRALLPAVRHAWRDIQNVRGELPFTHDNYLKIWQLSGPRIARPIIMFDEAQDANPVIAAIIEAQRHAQLVYVGDSQQSIMSFTGAVNALEQVGISDRSFLTQSFRFGPAVAELANVVLTWLEAPLKLRGLPSIDSTVGLVPEPDAILCRTNAMAVSEALRLQSEGITVHLVGGSAEVVEFAEAAKELQEGRRTDHRDLWFFESWAQVQAYVNNADEQGGDLLALVRLVNEFGVDVILAALANMVPEEHAQVVISTAHKSKGREWSTVRLAGDFPEIGPAGDGVAPEELRLLYVAITRARLRIDATAIPALAEPDPDDEPAPAVELGDHPADLVGPFICERDGCGRTYELNRRSGLADERYCGGLCRMKAERVAVPA